MARAAAAPPVSESTHGEPALTRGRLQMPRACTDRIGILVLAATFLGAALRLPFLAGQSLWFDETFTRSIVSHGSLAGVIGGVRATESTPPLYYVLTWAWIHVFGETTAMLRLPGALAGVLCVPAAYLALRRLMGARASIAAAWLVACSPMLVSYSLDARSYSLLVLFSILSLWTMSRVMEVPSPSRLAVWALACVALVYTHYFGGFVVAAEIAVLLRRMPERRRALPLTTAAMAVILLPLVPLLLHQSGGERTAFIAATPLLTRIEEALRQFGMGPNVPSAALEATGLLLVLAGVLAGCLALLRGHIGEAEAPTRACDQALADTSAATGVIVALLLFGVVLPLLLGLTHVDDVFLARNLLGAWIAVAALAGLGLCRMKAVPLALFCLLCIATVLSIQSNWRYQNVDWQGAIGRLQVRLKGQPVLVYGSQAAPVAALYLKRRAAPSPVIATSFWILVEPARTGTRALEPVPGTPAQGIPGPPFRLAASITFHGVRALHFLASAAAPIVLASFGTDSVDGSHPTLLAG
jgi:4-amino-4-deoxy-L-arabinose transferase-like glycosyltransferase